MWQSVILLIRRVLGPLVPDRVRQRRRLRMQLGQARRRSLLAATIGPEVLRGLDFEAGPAEHGALEALGRTEDVRFSPSGRRLALAGFYSDRVLVLSTRIVPAGETYRVVCDGHVMLTSPALRHPHGLAFLDDETLLVASRYGGVAVFALPPPVAGSTELRLAPIRIFRGTRLGLRFNPGSLDVMQEEVGRIRVLVCSNYSDSVTSHLVASDDGFDARYDGVLLKRGLSTPDGISVSPDQKWIAVSNHDDGSVRIFEWGPGLGPRSEPAGLLRGVAEPHGLRFTPDGRYLIVADASGPWVHVFASEDGDWRGTRDATRPVRTLDEETFERGLAAPNDGGPKGITLDGEARVVATTCEFQVLAFFDLQRLLAGTHQMTEQTTDDSSILADD
jgi:DNA-binding beta-propeller fold protein YncE